MSDLKFNVSGESTSATQFIAKTRQFTLVVDEPATLGGTDEYANPVEYILAGFAGCANVIGHVVAKELGFTIKNLRTLQPSWGLFQLFEHSLVSQWWQNSRSVGCSRWEKAEIESWFLLEIAQNCLTNVHLIVASRY